MKYKGSFYFETLTLYYEACVFCVGTDTRGRYDGGDVNILIDSE